MKQNTKDNLGSRMKRYESRETGRRAIERLPICVRIDGRAFHTFTRGLERPFDRGFARAMIETTKFLLSETDANIGYTQSDEITLIFANDQQGAETFLGGKFFKLTSIISSLATAKFNNLVPSLMPSKAGKTASFDTRVFQVPDLGEATNLLLWRWIDARKNSISMVAEAHFPSSELHGLKAADRIALLKEARGIDWELDFPSHLKYGTFVKRITVMEQLSADKLSNIPEKHRPTGPVKRHRYVSLVLPPLLGITNRTDVIFKGAEPVLNNSQGAFA